jgi:hypothetical protein
MRALRRKFKNLHLILTGEAACCEAMTSFTEDFKFKEHEELEIAHGDQLGPLADELHEQAITIRGVSPAGLLQQIGVDRLCDALRKVIPGNRPVVALYAGDKDELFVRVGISSVGFLHQLRDQVLIGDFERDLKEKLVGMAGSGVELVDAITRTEICADRTQFAEMYEGGILKLGKLTPHQVEKKRECFTNERDVLPSSDLHIQAPAGGGKTFLGLHIADDLLKGDPEVTVLFVATNLALVFFFANWLCTRQGTKSSIRKVLRRLYVLSEDGQSDGSNPGTTLVLQQFHYNNNKQQLEIIPVDSSKSAVEYSLLIVDEAHHLYRHKEYRETVEAHTGPSTRRILLSDVSQWTGAEPEYPKDMKDVILEEVVRNSERIVMGAMNFQTGNERSKKLSTKCHHDSFGPPLKTFLFEASNDDETRMEQYGDEVVKAISVVEDEYPGLELHNRVAIVVPDEEFREKFTLVLQQKIKRSIKSGHLGLVRASRASRAVQTRRKVAAAQQWLVVDTVSAFDGLERLIVIAVALDAVIGDENTGRARSHLYRGITRAHMLVLVVNEFLPGGWLEWLTRLELEEKKFDAEEERQAHIDGAVKEQLAEALAEALRNEEDALRQMAQQSKMGILEVGSSDGMQEEGRGSSGGVRNKGKDLQKTIQQNEEDETNDEDKGQLIKQSVWDTSGNSAKGSGNRKIKFMPRSRARPRKAEDVNTAKVTATAQSDASMKAVKDLEQSRLSIAGGPTTQEELTKQPVAFTVLSPQMDRDDAPSSADKFVVGKLISGANHVAAYGLTAYMGINAPRQGQIMQDGLKAIRAEFEKSGNETDIKLMQYVLDEVALEQEEMTPYGKVTRDEGHAGMRLEDFAQHQNAHVAKLELPHIAALRIYTSNAHKCINDPLRNGEQPHPFAATTFFLAEAVKKCRAINAVEHLIGDRQEFWRGMKDFELTDDFRLQGGIELGCLSTSSTKGAIDGYAKSEQPLVMCIVSESFMDRGVGVNWLSLYPNEAEVLYPPLTHIKYLKTRAIANSKGIVVYVKPSYSA